MHQPNVTRQRTAVRRQPSAARLCSMQRHAPRACATSAACLPGEESSPVAGIRSRCGEPRASAHLVVIVDALDSVRGEALLLVEDLEGAVHTHVEARLQPLRRLRGQPAAAQSQDSTRQCSGIVNTYARDPRGPCRPAACTVPQDEQHVAHATCEHACAAPPRSSRPPFHGFARPPCPATL